MRPTSPPDTDAGTPPAETQPPVQPPEQTAAPEQPPEETAAPATTPSSTVAPGDDGDGTVWWPWILGAFVVIGAVVAIARRRSSDPSWQIRATTLLDEIEQLTSHLAAIHPSGLHAVAGTDAMRLATMRAQLQELIASAPDAGVQMALNRLTTPIAELHGAIDVIAMSADPSIQPDGASVTRLATQLHTASASVRAELAVHG